MFSIERQQWDVKFRNSSLGRAIIANRLLIEFLGQVCAQSSYKTFANEQFYRTETV